MQGDEATPAMSAIRENGSSRSVALEDGEGDEAPPESDAEQAAYAGPDAPAMPAVIGRFEVVAPIATGGMAELFVARLRGPAGFHRPFAIKRILPHLAGNAEFRSMFVDEAKIVAGLHHPNVVQVHELGEQKQELYLVMEYLAGENVSALMRRLGRRQESLPAAFSAALVAEACAGLHAAHELEGPDGPRQVVHRDVSPQNLLLTYDGAVKVIDFGVAKALGRIAHTRTGHVKGKLGYMAPEQCRGDDVDRRTDIFALGILLHELLTGRRLFPYRSDAAVVRAICDEPIPAPSERWPGCPPTLDAVCVRALQKDPDQRFESADEMRRALLKASRGLDPELVLQDELAALMKRLFEQENADKEALLAEVRSGVGPLAAAAPASSEAPATAGQTPLAKPARVTTAVTAVERRAAGGPRRGALAAFLVLGLGVLAAVLSLGRAEPTTDAAASPTGPELAPAPSSISLQVRTTPSGAAVVLEGVTHGVTPLDIELAHSDEGLELRLRRDGYDEHVRQLTPDVAQRVEVSLRPVAAPTLEDDPTPIAVMVEEPTAPPSTAMSGRRRSTVQAMEPDAEGMGMSGGFDYFE